MSKLKELIESGEPLLVEFKTDWCPFCKVMEPVLQNIKDDLEDKLRIVKVNTQEHPGLGEEFGARSVPTFIAFKDGKQVWKSTGAKQEYALVEEIRNALKI